ncbi:hypothetical protein ACFQZ4_20110 [Catellatospora coxensis]
MRGIDACIYNCDFDSSPVGGLVGFGRSKESMKPLAVGYFIGGGN